MTTIYKLSSVKNNGIKEIVVFYGSRLIDKKKKDYKPINEINELFKREQGNIEQIKILFEGVFSEDEMEYINMNDINVRFVEEYIHIDDTIETIKKKIIKHTGYNISFDELFLFIKQFDLLNPITVYKQLTNNEKNDIKKEELTNFLLNLNKNSFEKRDTVIEE